MINRFFSASESNVFFVYPAGSVGINSSIFNELSVERAVISASFLPKQERARESFPSPFFLSLWGPSVLDSSRTDTVFDADLFYHTLLFCSIGFPPFRAGGGPTM